MLGERIFTIARMGALCVAALLCGGTAWGLEDWSQWRGANRDAKVTGSNVRGKDSAYDAANLIDGRRDTAWATDDEVHVAYAMLEFKRPVAFSVIAVKEDIRYGQRVDAFAVEHSNAGNWEQLAAGTSIGPRKYIRLDRPVTASRVRLRVTKASASPVLTQFSLFSEPPDASAR